MESTGERIKHYREALNMTQEELASKINTSPQNIYKYEKDIIRNIPLDKIQALSRIFDITPAQLVGWGDDSSVQFDQSSSFGGTVTPIELTTLSEDEKTLITLFRQNSREYQVALLNLLKARSNFEAGYGFGKPFNPLSLKLASDLPPYKFRNDKKNK